MPASLAAAGRKRRETQKATAQPNQTGGFQSDALARHSRWGGETRTELTKILKKMGDDSGARLKELKAKLKAGSITEEEYEDEKRQIRSSAPPPLITRQLSGNLSEDVRSLIMCVRIGKEKDFKSLIAADPSIISRCTDPSGNTLLHESARNGQKKIAKELLRNADQYDPYAKNTSGKTAVDLAREWNYVELADYLREKLPGISETLEVSPRTPLDSIGSGSYYGESSLSPRAGVPREVSGHPDLSAEEVGSAKSLLDLELKAKLELLQAEAGKGREEMAQIKAEREEKDRMQELMMAKLIKLMEEQEKGMCASSAAHEESMEKQREKDAELERLSREKEEREREMEVLKRDMERARAEAEAAKEREVQQLKDDVERARQEAEQERLMRARAQAESADKERAEAELRAKMEEIQQEVELSRLEKARMQADKASKEAEESELLAKLEELQSKAERDSLEMAKLQAQKAEAARVEAEQKEKLEEFKAAAEQERERLRVMQVERERQEAEEAALKTKIESLQSLADAEREAKGQSDKEREDLAAKMKQVLAEAEAEKVELARVQAERARAAEAEATLRHKVESMESDAARERSELERVQRDKAEREAAEAELKVRMDALKEETDKEKAEKAKLAEEKLKIEADMLEAERERQELIRIQAEKEKSDAKMKSKVEEERLRMEKEMAMLKGQLAAAKTEAEKAASPKIPKTRDEFNHEKQALLTDFEARRKELESHQKSEQDRQERMLQELLQMKKKKRQDKLGLDKQGAS